MKQLETPLPAEARTATAAVGKEAAKRLRAGGKSEDGAAFGDLLKGLDPRKGATSRLAAHKEEKAEADVAEPTSAIDLAAAPRDAAAMLAARLLAPHGDGNGPAAHGKDVAPRAAGSSGLAGALGDMASLISREAEALGIAKPGERTEPGIAMPDAGALPDLDLERLARALDGRPGRERADGGERGISSPPPAPGALASGKNSVAPRQLASGDGAAAARGTQTEFATDALALPADPDSIETVEAGSEEREPAGRPAMTVAVMRQETHLPPVMRLSPFQQIVEPIRQAAAELSAARGADALPEPELARSSEINTPTKVLHLELRPVELGMITVKMRLSQTGMEMRIEASRAETAAMLASDMEALRDVIRASGHSPDAVVIEAVHVDAMPGDWQRGPHRPEPGTDGAGARSDGRQFNDSRQGAQGDDARRHRMPDPPSSKDEPHDKAGIGRRGGDAHLYL